MSKNYIKLYKEIKLIRTTELTISKEYSKYKMRCPVHLSIGQEASAVGVCSAIRKTDQVVSSHRNHAHYLAKGGSLKKMIAEIYGKKNGCAEGKGGSMHLFDLNVNFIASIPIVGSIIPMGVGLAWANKLKKNNKIVVIFFGDGATEEGVFFESIDFAVLHNLNVLFVCENNFFSVYSHLSKRQSPKREILKLNKSLGIESLFLEGNNAIKINKKIKEIIKKIRTNPRPFLIKLNTYRFLEHCGPYDDDYLNYRSMNELNYWKKKCPLKNIENFLKKKKILNKKKIKLIELQINNRVKKAFEFAEKSPFPKKKELNKKIYF